MLTDNHGRPINYLRLAVTDRCNLRCFYCMPEHGIKYLPGSLLLTREEIVRIVCILGDLGVTKVRLTGGEPFIRPDFMEILTSLRGIENVNEIHITTNGLLTSPHVGRLQELGIKSVNLSLDTLDPKRFFEITRRNEFDQTWKTFQQLLASGISIKLNAVVMEGKNIDDIYPMIELTKNHPVSVRFIEEMPFNGEGNHYKELQWTHKKILNHILLRYPEAKKMVDPANATSSGYQIPGYQGSFGIIAAFTRTFCGSCNRIRVTAAGMLKTCLYDDGVLDIKKLLRDGMTDEGVRDHLLAAFANRPKNGFEAEQRRHGTVSESMSTIGG